MNSQTANAAPQKICYCGKLVEHELRLIASTTMNEAEFNYDVIEATLAHTDKNEARRNYNRLTYLEQSVALINWRSNFVKKHG